MKRMALAGRVPLLSLLLAAAALASVAPARAASPVQVAAANLDFTVAPPGPAAAPASRYERAPMPNEDTLAPSFASAGIDDPLQPSVMRRSSSVGQSDGYSYGSSQQSAVESRMRPALGFALHLPTD